MLEKDSKGAEETKKASKKNDDAQMEPMKPKKPNGAYVFFSTEATAKYRAEGKT